VAQEANGWAAEEELFERHKAGSSDVYGELLRTRAHYDTKQRDDGGVVWKRDPNLVKGFVPTELWRFIENIAGPTLYILGGDSPIVPPETQERLKATIPDCQTVVFPGVGHYRHLERPDDDVAEVNRFLSKGHDEGR
jgi:pimeloyl-ACP methyl ester carboxylesterase